MLQSRSIEVERHRRSAKLMGALMSAASLTAIAATGAHAQTTAASQAPAATNQLQEVVVTANRSGAQSVQNVAIPISVVTPTEVDRSGLGNLSDLAKFAPSLEITEGAPGFNQITMLGLTSMPYRTSDTSDRSLVAVYLDDTPISVQGQTPDLRVYDLERVEILEGPQGTLYGDSSMAGTVRYITAKPSSTSSFGTLEVTGADTDHGAPSYSIRAMFNTPLIDDKLGFRGTFYDGQDGGYINNIGDRDKKDANLNDSLQARGALRWTPDKTLTVDFAATFEQSHAYGLNTVESGLAPYTDSTNGPEGTRDSFQLYQLNIDKDLGFADLISSTSYTWRRIGYQASTEATIGYYFSSYYYKGLPGLKSLTNEYPYSYAGYAGPPYSQALDDELPAEHYDIDNKIHDVMQEIRLVSKDDGPVKWTVGGFYENQGRKLFQDIPVAGFDADANQTQYISFLNSLEGGQPYNSENYGAFHPNDIFSGLQNETDSQFALFTDDTWHATKKLDLTAGVRYFDYNESYYLYEGGIFSNDEVLSTSAKEKASGFNPRFNASYHVDDDLMVYGEAAKGFRYGGANQPLPIATPAKETGGSTGQECLYDLQEYGFNAAPLTFGPDNLWDYTLGEKAKLANGRMTFNADAYYIDWSNVQTRLQLACSYFFTESAGSIHSKGVEAQTTFKVTPALTVSGSVGYNDSHAAANIPTVGAFAGDQAPYSPNWIASAFVFYDKPVADGVMHLQASYQFRSEQNTTFDPYSTSYDASKGLLSKTTPNSAFAIIPPSNDVNASAAYDFGRYEIGIYGTNLTNGLKVTNIAKPSYYQPFVAGSDETIARPLTVGVRLKAKF